MGIETALTAELGVGSQAAVIVVEGADPTGNRDSQPMIMRAINMAAPNHGTVLIPPGRYKLDSPLHILGLGLTLAGSGGSSQWGGQAQDFTGAATILMPSGDFPAIWWQHDYMAEVQPGWWAHVRDLAILGSADPAGGWPTTTLSTAISGTGALTVEVASTSGFPSSGFILIESEWMQYTSLSASPVGFVISSSGNRGANGTTATTHTTTGVSVTLGPGSIRTYLTSNQQHGIVVDCGGLKIDNVTIANCGGHGLYFLDSEGGHYNNVQCIGNHGDGLRLDEWPDQTRLSTDMGASDTTASVVSTESFPSSGTIRIGTEQFTYSGKTATTLTGLSPSTHGTHSTDDLVTIVDDAIDFFAKPTTTLSGALAQGATSLSVVDTSEFPATGTLQIDGETISYTIKNGTWLSGLSRGQNVPDGDSAHSNGATVTLLPGRANTANLLNSCGFSSSGGDGIRFRSGGTGNVFVGCNSEQNNYGYAVNLSRDSASGRGIRNNRFYGCWEEVNGGFLRFGDGGGSLIRNVFDFAHQTTPSPNGFANGDLQLPAGNALVAASEQWTGTASPVFMYQLPALGLTRGDLGTVSSNRTIDWAAVGSFVEMTLGSNVGFTAFNNPRDSLLIFMIIKQDATGTRNITNWGGGVVSWRNNAAPVLSSTPNARDCFLFYFNRVDGTYYEIFRSIQGDLQQLDVGSSIAAAATIAPTSPITHITGTAAAIATITVPAAFNSEGGQLTLIPDAAWSTNTSGNIAVATTAVVSKALIMTYDAGAAKWYPSY